MNSDRSDGPAAGQLPPESNSRGAAQDGAPSRAAKPEHTIAIPTLVTLGISLVALSLSGATFYRNFLFVDRSLSASMTSLEITGDEQVVRVVVTNAGNRDAAVVDASLARWEPRAGWIEDTARGFAPVVLKAHEIKVITVTAHHPLSRVAPKLAPLEDTDEVEGILAVTIESVDDTASSYITRRVVGSATFPKAASIAEPNAVVNYGRRVPLFSNVKDSADWSETQEGRAVAR